MLLSKEGNNVMRSDRKLSISERELLAALELLLAKLDKDIEARASFAVKPNPHSALANVKTTSELCEAVEEARKTAKRHRSKKRYMLSSGEYVDG